MASVPYLLLSPKVLVSLIGLLRGRNRSSDVAAGAPLAQDVVVDVIVPARNEEATISLALASLESQTVRPRRVVVVDDASRDRTFEVAKAYADESSLPISVVRHDEPRGKTPGLKELACESDADAIFVLDADTVLMSEDYLATLVRTVFERPSVASASGMILPLRDRDRHRLAAAPLMNKFLRGRPGTPFLHDRALLARYLRWTTNVYREVLYYFIQNVVYRGEMELFGTIMNSVGCGVLYRRAYLMQALRDAEALGDDLTVSEDVFLGFSFVDCGYRNVQNLSVLLRSEEPRAETAPVQIVRWASAWFQSAYYFPALLTSPGKCLRRWKQRRRARTFQERRRHNERWRQPFGREFTARAGRPAGWIVFLTLFEKVSFPLFMILFFVLGWWRVLALTLLLETVLMVLLLVAFGGKERFAYAGMTFAVTPLRYGTLLFDAVTVSRFLVEALKPGRKHWRK